MVELTPAQHYRRLENEPVFILASGRSIVEEKAAVCRSICARNVDWFAVQALCCLALFLGCVVASESANGEGDTNGIVKLVGLSRDTVLYVDGARVSATYPILSLSPGSHTLQFERLEGGAVQALIRKIKVRSNQEQVLLIELLPVFPLKVFPGPPGNPGGAGPMAPPDGGLPYKYNQRAVDWMTPELWEVIEARVNDTLNEIRVVSMLGLQPLGYRIADQDTQSQVVKQWGPSGPLGIMGPRGLPPTFNRCYMADRRPFQDALLDHLGLTKLLTSARSGANVGRTMITLTRRMEARYPEIDILTPEFRKELLNTTQLSNNPPGPAGPPGPRGPIGCDLPGRPTSETPWWERITDGQLDEIAATIVKKYDMQELRQSLSYRISDFRSWIAQRDEELSAQ